MKTFSQYLDETYFDDAARRSLNELYSALGENEPPDDLDEETIEEALVAIPLIVRVVELLLAAPLALKVIAKSVGYVIRQIKSLITGKKDDEPLRIVRRIVVFAYKWQKSYTKAIRFVLKKFGLFSSAGVDSAAQQKKISKIIFYCFIIGILVAGGLFTIRAIRKAIKAGDFATLGSKDMEDAVDVFDDTGLMSGLQDIMNFA